LPDTAVRLRLPHPFVLLLVGVAVAALLTWIIPAGSYQRRPDAALGRDVVIAGTYATMAATPVSLPAAVMAVPRGIASGIDVILTVFFVGGAFALLDASGALGRLVSGLVGRTRNPRLIVAVICVAFATLGALENMQEEIIALVPVLLVLSAGLGFGALTALSMSVGAAAVGSAFGPTNPFQTGIALKFAELPAMSQPVLRVSMLVVAVALWVMWTLFMTTRDDVRPAPGPAASTPPSKRDALLLLIALVPFIPYVYGVLRHDWGFHELSALFVVAGFAIGLASGMSLDQTAAAFLKGMEGLLAAGLYVGIARSISVVLADGHILDTIVYGLALPMNHAPRAGAALLMVPVQALLHIPVVSVSGQAALTMPIMAPLCDLLGIGRDAAVIAFQTGAGLMDVLVPTNGAMLAMLATAGVSYGRWMRHVVPGMLLVAVVGLVGLLAAL
jgi:uncharacterized ion transporter superfamily protein YfcC